MVLNQIICNIHIENYVYKILVFTFPVPQYVMGADMLDLVHLSHMMQSPRRGEIEWKEKWDSVFLTFEMTNHTLWTYLGVKLITIDTYNVCST